MSYENYSGFDWRWFQVEKWVNEHGWTKGAELGVWKGATFLYLLDNCPDLTLIGVDLWAPQEDKIEAEKEWKKTNPKYGPESYVEWPHEANERIVRERSKRHGNRAIIYKMYTDEAADLVEDGSLDFVFIDADHTYEGVKRDIAKWRPKLRPTGWLLGHDINWPSVRQAVEEEVPGYITGLNFTWGRQK